MPDGYRTGRGEDTLINRIWARLIGCPYPKRPGYLARFIAAALEDDPWPDEETAVASLPV